MKICYISDANSPFVPNWGEALTKRGWTVLMLSPPCPSLEGITLCHIDIYKGFYVPRPSIIRRMKKFILKHRPDILHARPVLGFGMYGALMRYHPYIVSACGSEILIATRKTFWKRQITKYVLRRADAVIALSKHLASETKKYCRKKIFVIPDGINVEFFKPRPKMPRDYLGIGFVKGLSEICGADYLIRAIPEVCKKIPNIRVWIIGDGTLRPELEKLAKKLKISQKVVFLGSRPHSEMPDHFSKMDIFVQCSLVEGLGIAPLEAQAMGLPVIASNIGALPEVVVDGKTGYLVPPANPDAIATRLIELLSNEKKRTEMGVQAREWVIKKFDQRLLAEQIEKFYLEQISGGI